MARAWPFVHLCALAFVGAWFIGHYSGDAGTDFARPEIVTLRVAPNVIVTAPPLRLTAKELRLRALREPRNPIVILKKRP